MPNPTGIDADLERMIATFDTANKQHPDYAERLVRLAEVVIKQGHKLRGFRLCREALAQCPGDGELLVRVRRLLSSLVPRYHIGMMNDAGRAAAWGAALRRVIRPDSHVLEVGTGGGLLALLAARAGAALVTTCETDPVLAAVATEIVEQNGFGDRIRVINKPSHELVLGADLESPADVFCFDIFGDRLLDFGPLDVLAGTRNLLVPGARIVPEAMSLHVALAHWTDYSRLCRLERAAGFDCGLMEMFVPPSLPVSPSDARLAIRSAPVEVFRFESAEPGLQPAARKRVRLEANASGPVSGVIQWIRLDLSGDTFLETKPRADSNYFGTPRFWPRSREVTMQRGDSHDVEIDYQGRRVTIWDAPSADGPARF